jgi:hypothetical protein
MGVNKKGDKKMTTQEAKRESQQMDKIVHIDWEHSIELELDVECDDSSGWYKTDDGKCCEFWGEDESGEWRVHLHQ